MPDTDNIEMSLAVDEGKQFFVRRIDFSGNTTTRDKVIRREMLIDEGEIFNKRLWELSILRLNQLGYFEPLKAEEAAEIKRDTKTNTVDITLKVKERGKNSIQLNGGVSGIAGSFVGASYSTNNFLGLGETLSLSSQLGTRMRAACSSASRSPTCSISRSRAASRSIPALQLQSGAAKRPFCGTNLIPYYNSLGPQNLLNYISNGYGGTVFVTYPLQAQFRPHRHNLRLRHLECPDVDRRRQRHISITSISRASAAPIS